MWEGLGRSSIFREGSDALGKGQAAVLRCLHDAYVPSSPPAKDRGSVWTNMELSIDVSN